MGRFTVRRSPFAHGFTLVELLVVIAIIGLLVGVVAVNANAARSQARDDRRETDLTNIAGALELYRAQHREYPPNLQPLEPTFINDLPTDPLGGSYQYLVDSTRRRFALDATLEGQATVSVTPAPPSNPSSLQTFQTGYYLDGSGRYHYRVSGQ